MKASKEPESFQTVEAIKRNFSFNFYRKDKVVAEKLAHFS